MEAENIALLKKFLFGTCTSEEKRRVALLLRDPHTKEILEDLTLESWSADEQAESMDPQLREAWRNHLQDRIGQKEESPLLIMPRSRHRGFRYAAIWMGALFLLSVIWGYYQVFVRQKAPVSYVQLANPKGAPQKFTLPDSTVVYLGAGSTVLYPERWMDGQRQVKLKGEAFFDVAVDPKRPFMLMTDSIQTEVLGTSFKVEAFDPAHLLVAVATGKVRISRSDSKRNQPLGTLVPGEALSWDGRQKRATKQEIMPASLLSWTSGELEFQDRPLAEIVEIMQRYFGVELIIANPELASYQLSGAFPEGKSVEQILKTLSIAGGFQYKKQNQYNYIMMK